MANNRHPEDILFIVAEQDYRIYEEDLRAKELAMNDPDLEGKMRELEDKCVKQKLKIGMLAQHELTTDSCVNEMAVCDQP